MEELPTSFTGTGEVKGLQFRQLESNEKGSFYEVSDSEGHKHYEVFGRVEQQEGIRVMQGIEVPIKAKVLYPKSNSFGITAWCIRDFNKATMKWKTLFIGTALMLLSIFSFGQSRLGFTKDEIFNEFNDGSTKIEYAVNKNGVPTLSADLKTCRVIYVIRDDGYCYKTLILPKSEELLHSYIQHYNKEYVIISDTEWKAYISGIPTTVKLIFDDGVGYFTWNY